LKQKDATVSIYNVITAFTIEPHQAAYPDSPNKLISRPIKAIMTTFGYSIPDPTVPNRHSVCITGFRMEPNNDAKDLQGWKSLFGKENNKVARIFKMDHSSLPQHAKRLASQVLTGAKVQKQMDPCNMRISCSFSRPLGGHGKAYVDTLYVDNSLRIIQGHRGTIFVFTRIPNHVTI
jgi:hypothetical protein